MPRRTILICGPPPTAVGGGPTHMRNLWASPLATEFDLVLFETGSRGAESPARDEPPLAMLWRLVSTPFALARVLATRRPVVVHLNTSMDPRGFWREWLNLIVCRLFARRVAYQVHGGSLSRLMEHAWMRPVARSVFRSPDALVVLARVEQAQFERMGGIRRLVVIANAIDVGQFQGAGERVHSGRVRRLGYLGRLVDGKGLMEAIAAVDELRRERGFEDLELRLAGTGDAAGRLEAEIARRGLGGIVRLVGSLHGSEKVAFLAETDVFLLPSESEGLPYSVIESLASGTPVVASRVGGIPDVVVDGAHGILVPPRDPRAIAGALRELAASPDRLRAMSRQCARRAEEEFGLARLARQFAALYRELGAI